MKSLLQPAIALILPILLAASHAGAAEKTYEKPTAFLTRVFGSVPKTRVLALGATQQKQLAAILGHPYREQKIRYWADAGKTAWILDEIGKTEPITTGFVIRNGRIAEMKVLIYRESHGWEVSRPFFTGQFQGASLTGTRLNKKVDGIVGATLSVRALTKLGAAALYLASQSGD